MHLFTAKQKWHGATMCILGMGNDYQRFPVEDTGQKPKGVLVGQEGERDSW